jgi:hypothetical protein
MAKMEGLAAGLHPQAPISTHSDMIYCLAGHLGVCRQVGVVYGMKHQQQRICSAQEVGAILVQLAQAEVGLLDILLATR